MTDLPRKATDEEQVQQFMVCTQGEDQPSKYICLVCSKTYTSRYNIRMHLNMHTGNFEQGVGVDVIYNNYENSKPYSNWIALLKHFYFYRK